MGCIFGSSLFKSGQDVLLYDVNQNTVKKINDDGLCIINKNNENQTIPEKATFNPGDTRDSDLLIIFSKCFHTAIAIASLRPYLNVHTKILSLQNGWGNARAISNITGRIIYCWVLTTLAESCWNQVMLNKRGSLVAFVGRWSYPANAQNIQLDYEERMSTIMNLLKNATAATSSMLQEEAVRKTEIDVINDAVVSAGEQAGIATPFNQSMVLLITSLEQNNLQNQCFFSWIKQIIWQLRCVF